jgi:hypothetical protein
MHTHTHTLTEATALSPRKHLTDRDYRAMEGEWDQGDEFDEEDRRTKWTPDENGELKPPDRKMEMVFCEFVKTPPDIYYEESDTWGVERLKERWLKKMKTAGMSDIMIFEMPDSRRFLFQAEGVRDIVRLKNFLFDQPEVIYFEQNSKKYYPPKRPQTQDSILEDEERDRERAATRAKAKALEDRLAAKAERKAARLKREAAEAEAKAEKVEL